MDEGSRKVMGGRVPAGEGASGDRVDPGPESAFLNFHHLRYFWAVAREGTLRKAAEKLSVSQPSICAQVKLLESALGQELFRVSGRSLVLTEFGRTVLGYAEEIFALGNEVVRSARVAAPLRRMRLGVGIVDSFPKLMSYELLSPVFQKSSSVQVTCHEGKIGDLLGMLTAHRLDVVLADEPASPGASGRVFNHRLGSCGVSFCAEASLVGKLKGRFPECLTGAAALLPTQNCTLRRDLEKWFRVMRIEPVVVGEFEDAALSKIAGAQGLGFLVVPTLVEREAVERYRFEVLGRTREVMSEFYAITAERRVAHPLVALITGRGLEDGAPGLAQ